MDELVIIYLSVGNGDSIFLDYRYNSNKSVFGLIDCNDSVNLKSTHIFLKRYFDMRNVKRANFNRLFNFIMLSHAHGDHLSGLQDIIKTYGTDNFFHSRTIDWGGHAPLQQYLNRSRLVGQVHAIDTRFRFQFGNTDITVLWPLDTSITSRNENNNSIVATIEHFNNQFVFCGDAEYDVWNNLNVDMALGSLPRIRVFKVPHHGANNGTIDPISGRGTWPNSITNTDFAVISSHINPYGHPDQSVLNMLNRNAAVFNTTVTENQNIEIVSDGSSITARNFQ